MATAKPKHFSRTGGIEATKRITIIMAVLGAALIMNIVSSHYCLIAQRIRLQSSPNLSALSLDASDVENTNFVPPIRQLSKSHIQDGIECPYPLVPIYDKIVQRHDNNSTRITKAFHFAWIKGYNAPNGTSRCISPDMMEVPQKWMENFPSYSIYFHDDESVEALFAQEWPEFPALGKFMKSCVMYGNAMKIDIWRQMILYRYGGVYVDFDMLPGPKFTEESIDPDDSAVFLSDVTNRPSQWCMAMEPKCPIAYFTLVEIMKNLQKMEDVSEAKLVFTTGPGALKTGYKQVVETTEKASTMFKVGVHRSTLSTGLFRKLPLEEHAYGLSREKVPYPRNHKTNNDYVNITKKDRALKEMGSEHWLKLIKRTQKRKASNHERCTDLMYWNDMNATQVLP